MELDSPQYKSDKSMMANIVPSRTRDLVNQKLNDAKLQPETFYPTGQCIFFDNNLDTDNIKLLELDTTLVQDLEAGKSLTIKGEKSENAVVVTEDKTYELRAAETSNIFLITRNSITLDRMKAEHFGTRCVN
jgi:sister chromatid cohesion protein DCC1